MGLQFYPRQNPFPVERNWQHMTCGFASLERAALRKISFEVRSIHFQAIDVPGRPKFDNHPIVTRTTSSLCLPAVAHVHGTTGHDQVMPVAEKHITAGKHQT